MPRTFTIPTVFTAVNKFSAPLRTMTTHLAQFTGAAEVGLARAERGFRALMSPLTAVGRLLRYFGYFFGGAAVVLGLSSVIKQVVDFQQATADLNAVMTDATPEMMRRLTEDAKRLGLTTARTAVDVTGLQTELAKLGYQGPEILNMTKALVSGSIAMDASLERTATLGGAMIRTFTKLSSADMPMVMDQMTLATLDTALSFEKLETMLPIVSGAANAVGITLSRQLALLGKLADAGIDASSSATALRNIFIDSRRRGHSYDQVLENIAKHADMLTPAFNKFGKRGAVSAVVLANKLKEVAMAEQRILNSAGVAESVAAKRLNTIKGSWTLLMAAYRGYILTLEDGTGKHAAALKAIIDTARGAVLLAAGTKDAMEAFAGLNPRVQQSARNTLDWLGFAWKVVKVLIAIKLALVAARIALTAYSIWMGIAGAVTGVASVAIGANAIALTSYRVTAWLAVAATQAFALAVRAATFATSPLGAALLLTISLIDSLIRNWDDLKKTFETQGFWAGIGKFAAIFNDAILYPIQQLFDLLSGLPGFLGSYFEQAAKGIQRIRAWNGTAEDPDAAPGPAVPQTRSDRIRQKYDSIQMATVSQQMEAMFKRRAQEEWNGKMSVEYKGPPWLQPQSQSDSVRVRVGSTMGYGPTDQGNR